MPRLVDPHARRRDLSEAALALAEADGLQAVTVARVAARSGVSVGNVQHWYPAKEQLLIATYEACLGRLTDRIDAQTSRAETSATIREMLLTALEEFLPAGPAARAECRVRAEFHGRAARDDRLADAERTAMAGLHARVSSALANGRECGETAVDLDADVAAWELLAVASGLAGLSLHGPVPTRDILKTRVSGALPHPCRGVPTGPAGRAGGRTP